MNDEELVAVWRALHPTLRQRRRLDARVSMWLEAGDTPLVAEWVGLFRVAPFSATGLVAVSAVAVAAAAPLVWVLSVVM